MAVENLLASEVPEILVSNKYIYMNSCDEFVEVYSFAKQGWVSSFHTEASPCEMQTELKNGSNRRKQLIIVSNKGCSYNGCGPQRGRKWVYEFGSDGVILINEELLPSSYRIHALEDGEIAIEKGDLETAIEFYDKAARDNSLIDVLTTDETDKQVSQNIPMEKMQQTAHDYQTAFAYFREFVLLHYLNRDDDALKIFDQMKTLYPEGKSGIEFVDISSYFLDRINSGSTVQESCGATNEYLAEKYILSANDFVYPHLNGWGDLSPQIGELLCPVVNLP
jgi:tetratricopeptide (TPR) repeat protein